MADTLSVEALGALDTVLATLLPDALPAGLGRELRVCTQRVRPLGMGGFVGSHVDPSASLFGRRVDARFRINISGADDSAASTYIDTLANAVLTQSRGELATLGIHRLHRLPAESIRELAFEVDFEFIKLPDTGEGTILDLIVEASPDN